MKFLLASLCFLSLPVFSEVGIKITPDSPVVITADYTDWTGKVVKAPWFRFNTTIENKDADSVTILEVRVTSRTPEGQEVTNVMSPSQYNYTLTCSSTVTAPITFQSFGTVIPNSTAPLILEYSGAGLPSECSGLRPNITNPPIFSGGNHETHGTYVYNVSATFIGWYGTFSNPHKRFEKTVQFVTQ